MIHDYGRIDWKPRLHKWRVVGYFGRWAERRLGDYNTYEEAEFVLREHVDRQSKKGGKQ